MRSAQRGSTVNPGFFLSHRVSRRIVAGAVALMRCGGYDLPVFLARLNATNNTTKTLTPDAVQ